MLSELFEMMEFTDVKPSDSNKIKEILNYCTENYTKDISLESISKELYISKYYISHLFRQKLHTGFTEYIGMLRISDACSLLMSEDKSITEVAYSVGFNSMRSFNRSFLKVTGKVPREYRQNFLNAEVQADLSECLY